MVISCFDTEWKKYYRCDLEGNVYRLPGTPKCKVERMKVPELDKRNGYLSVRLDFNKKRYHIGVHRLVAMYFIHNFDNKSTVEHKNHIKADNRLVNLCWFTSSQQQEYRVSNCNEKYIHLRKEGRIDIEFKKNNFCYHKSLHKSKTLIDAILQRDKMLSMF